MQIDIFGLGAIGSNLLLQLVKKYPDEEFCGIDFDSVEERNIATQAYLLPHIGIKKALAMSAILGLNTRKFNYIPIAEKLTKDNISKFLCLEDYLAIDCFDNTESRNLLTTIDKSVNILHVGFSPHYTAEIIWDENYSVPNDVPPELDDICEMSEAIPFIHFVVSRACGVISNFLDKNIKEDYIVTNKYDIRKLN